jgi:hypothetical protein
VQPERFQDDDRDDVNKQKGGDENEMQQELEKTIHFLLRWFTLK